MQTFRKRLLATRGLGEELLALRDGLATEPDTLLGVKNGALPYKGLDATGTAIYLAKRDLINDLVAVFTDFMVH